MTAAATAPPAESPLRVAAMVTRVHIVAIAAMGTFTFGWLFSGGHPWLVTFVSALDWFLVNLLNRVVDIPEDEKNGVVGTSFVARRRAPLMILGFGAMLASFVAVFAVAPAITPLRFAFHALGLAYNWPLLPGNRRIKQLYFWKNTASAMGFMLTVFGYPLAVYGWGARGLALSWTAIALGAAFFFLFELSYEVLYDMRDAPGDAVADVRTYPVVHGLRGATVIFAALAGTSVVILVLGFLAGAVPWRLAVMAVAPIIQLVYARRAIPRGVTSGDCVGLTWLGAALLLAYNLWIASGLPGVGA